METLENDLQRQTKRNHALSPTLQIFVALRFFASGSFLQIIGDTFGLPKSSFSRVVKDVTCSSAEAEGIHLVAISRRTSRSEKRVLHQGKVPWCNWSTTRKHLPKQSKYSPIQYLLSIRALITFIVINEGLGATRALVTFLIEVFICRLEFHTFWDVGAYFFINRFSCLRVAGTV